MGIFNGQQWCRPRCLRRQRRNVLLETTRVVVGGGGRKGQKFITFCHNFISSKLTKIQLFFCEGGRKISISKKAIAVALRRRLLVLLFPGNQSWPLLPHQ
jgi:hypothetical protein